MKRKKIRVIRFVGLGAILVVAAALVLRFSPSATRQITDALHVTQPSNSSATSTRQPPNPQIPAQAAAVVTSVSGAVTVTRNGVSMDATNRMKLIAGDQVHVSTDGAMTITWPYYGRTYVDGGTTFILTQAFESTDRLRFLARLTLTEGRVWSRIEQPLRLGSVFGVRYGNVLATTPGASFGVWAKPSAGTHDLTVQSLESSTDVFRMQDQPTTLEERQRGYNTDLVEHVVGSMLELSTGQEVALSSVTGTLPDAKQMTTAEKSDPFVVAGTVPATEEDLDVTPLPINASSTFDGS